MPQLSEETKHICFISRRISSGGRANLKPCLFEFTCRSGHVPGMSDQRNTADPVLFQYGEALVGIFPGVARKLLQSILPEPGTPFPAPLSFVPLQTEPLVGGVATRRQYGFTGKPMQPRRIADALQAEAAYSVTAIFRRVKVCAAPQHHDGLGIIIQGNCGVGASQCPAAGVGDERNGQQVKQNQRETTTASPIPACPLRSRIPSAPNRMRLNGGSRKR